MSVYDHRCADCQFCPACGRSAWCEGDRILVIPCEHHGFCGDCALSECADCQAEAEADIAATLRVAFDRFDGDPFRRPGDDSDPLPELAAESRAVTERFWAGVMRGRADQQRGLA